MPDFDDPHGPVPRRPRHDPGSARRQWLTAWLVALLLHAAAIVGLGRVVPARPTAASPAAPETVRVSLTGPDAAREYTELPKDRADAAAQRAALLANVPSRARDRAPAGEADAPRLRGEGEAPAVRLERGASPAHAAAAAAPAPAAAQPEGLQPADPARASVLLARRSSPGAGREAPGGAAVTQEEMDSPDGNAQLTGDVSLSTTAWDYAPWLDRYRAQLMEHWYAPTAYRIGLLKDGGWAVIEVEIARTGQVLRQDLLGQQGHPSLIWSAQSAVHASAPTDPLPADFPEPTLILRIRMIYPKVRPR